ncbi:MAG TPA: ABC transporter ATP-binding protein [Candidatus Methanoperedens sp.]|nr:ABC transporter ATP-binding protein [Candidatus Methanoperedens sp.]
MNDSRSATPAEQARSDNAASPVLDVAGLSKSFGSIRAVDALTFSLAPGEFVGLLGPNGAGKTTIIKMLTGLMRPDAGTIRYYGRDFLRRPLEAKRDIGVVHQISNLDRDLTARENLTLHAVLHGLGGALRRERIEETLRLAGLESSGDRPVKTFSGGMGRRLVIVRALLHEPKILFLDEPTVGLDPQIRRDLWDLIIRINQSRKTAILLTTHYIEEAERLCSRVLILNDGRLAAEDSPAELKRGMGKFVVEFLRDEGMEEAFFETREEAVARLGTCTGTCKVREATLEDVFLKLTGRRIAR